MVPLLDALFCISWALRLRAHRYVAVAALTAALVILSAWLAGCEDEQEVGPGVNQPVFTEAEAAKEAGLTVYWLGPSFEAGGVLFRISEAYFPEGFAGVPLQGLEVGYSSQPEPAGILYLQVLSRSDWDQVKEKAINARMPGTTQRAVSVAGRDGDLFLQAAGARSLNALWLIVDLGDVILVAHTNSGVAPAAQGEVELNPLIANPDLFIQVMQGLRPYPD
jgi:hypothetical protein